MRALLDITGAPELSSAGSTSVTAGEPLVMVPVCLVEHHGLYGVQRLKRLGALEEHAHLGTLAGAHHNGNGGGEAQGARGN